MRGDLASRPIDDVLIEAEKLVKGGVKELLVISQDTSAYGRRREICRTPVARQKLSHAYDRSLRGALPNWAYGRVCITSIHIRMWMK